MSPDNRGWTVLKLGTRKLVLHLKWLKRLTATLLTLVMTWQETYLLLILFQKAILSQLTPLSLLKVIEMDWIGQFAIQDA